MPNWCRCELTVTGPDDRAWDFAEFAKGEDDGEVLSFDFNRFAQYPSVFADRDGNLEQLLTDWVNDPNRPETPPKDGFNSGGHEWRLENWGTKWNACSCEARLVIESDGRRSVVFLFETAWSPPRPVVKKAAELFPDLTFDLFYFEPGVGFEGHFACRGGVVVKDDVEDINLDEE